MNYRAIYCCLLSALLTGCISTPMGLPETKDEVVGRMKLIRLAEVDIPQEGVMPTLRDFEALAKYAMQPFRLSTRRAQEEIDKAHADWLAIRQPLAKPRPYGRYLAQWEPPEPARVPPVATVKMRNTTLYEALTIICNVSGLQWSIDRWNTVVVAFRETEGQQGSPPLPRAPQTGHSEGAR